MHPNTSVLISGGGIAGSALAFWLRRSGFAVTVVERSTGPRPGGYKVDLRGAAVTVIDRMGLGDAVRARITDMRGGTWLTSSGRRMATLDGNNIGFRDPGDLELLRDDLAGILRDATTDVDHRYGDRVIALTEDADGVAVRFASGRTGRFDLVVGADGLHSGTRELAFGPESRFTVPMGLSVAVGSAHNRLGLDRWEYSYTGGGKVANLYSLDPNGRLTAQFFFRTPDAGGGADPVAQRRTVADLFGGHGGEVARIVAELSDDDWYYDDLAQVVMDDWSRGRVVLLGDAGYCPSPASGQGTSLAVVGAYVLAGELAGSGADHRAAFARYAQIMRPFVSLNLQLGRDVAKRMVPANRFGAAAQLTMLRLMPYLPGKGRVMEQIMRPVREAANGIELPEHGGRGNLTSGAV